MIVCHFPYGPTTYFSLHNVVLRHDINTEGTVSEAYPHLIFHNFSSKLGARVQSVLQYLFPVPKEESKRVMTFSNQDDFISYRHHVYQKITAKDVQLAEVGPRFELKRTCCTYALAVTQYPPLTPPLSASFDISPCSISPFCSYISLSYCCCCFSSSTTAYQIKLGTIDMAEADEEWVLRPYMRTTKKREFLAE